MITIPSLLFIIAIHNLHYIVHLGHSIECGWFLLKEAQRAKSKELAEYASKYFIQNPLSYGEDKDNGGLFYFLDVEGRLDFYPNSGHFITQKMIL